MAPDPRLAGACCAVYRSLARLVGILPLALSATVPALAAPTPATARAVSSLNPIVIGQSLPLGSADDGTAVRVSAGAEVYVEAINAQGGIHGRLLKLVTLSDDANPALHAQNLRRLVQEHKAVALLNCVGDSSCAAAAAVAHTLGVPLIGPMARSKRLTRQPSAFVFRVRASFDREADVLARQLFSMGVSVVALLTESAPDAEPVQALQAAMQRRGLLLNVISLPTAANPRAVADALVQLGKATHQAAVLDLSVGTLDGIARDGLEQRKEWPMVLTSPSSGALNALLSVFSSHIVGFTTLVPNPELSSLPLTAELQRHADRSTFGAWAITYSGLEAYINTRVCVEAIRRAGTQVEPALVASALASMNSYDLGGFTVSFGAGRPSGSDKVDIGVRSLNGLVRK